MKFCSSSAMREVIVHADDFGITKAQSQRILDCSRLAAGALQAASAGARTTARAARVAVEGAKVAADAVRGAAGRAGGALNSLSVLVTSPRYRECAALLKQMGAPDGRLSVGLHVNVVEGRCAAEPGHIPLLARPDGVFKRGFGGLLLVTLVRPRASREQLTEEVSAQIALFLEEFPELRDRLRLDSHQHFHLIPAVFDALVAAVEQNGCTVEYIRIPAEPLMPFIRARAVHLVAPINWVKHGVLNVLWQFDKHKVPDIKQYTAVFCGIGFSGHMTCENVGRVARVFKDYAMRKGMPVEFLFHPGGVSEPGDCLNPSLAGFVDFYTSPNRDAEAKAVKELAVLE